MGLVLANMIWTKLIGRLAEESCEPLDSANISAYSCLREVTSLEFLQHYFAKMGHRNLLVTHTILLASTDCFYLYPRVASGAPASSCKSTYRRIAGRMMTSPDTTFWQITALRQRR